MVVCHVPCILLNHIGITHAGPVPSEIIFFRQLQSLHLRDGNRLTGEHLRACQGAQCLLCNQTRLAAAPSGFVPGDIGAANYIRRWTDADGE